MKHRRLGPEYPSEMTVRKPNVSPWTPSGTQDFRKSEVHVLCALPTFLNGEPWPDKIIWKCDESKWVNNCKKTVENYKYNALFQERPM